MVNTVLGAISSENIGVALMHEHLAWDWDGADNANEYDTDQAVSAMLPYLLDLKGCGCDTFVDATTYGAGRDMRILKECSEKSGLNIVTNIGAYDGSNFQGKYVPGFIKAMNADELVDFWYSEFLYGVDGTDVKPGFIKVALGDTGIITELQEKLLRAAARTSIITNLPVQCHSHSISSTVRAVGIVEEENLPMEKFIWVHADGKRSNSTINQLAAKGIWIELDWVMRRDDFTWYADTIKGMSGQGYTGQLLLSQDAGMYILGNEGKSAPIVPYTRLFKEFVPLCLQQGISKGVLDRILIDNPKKILDI